MEKTGDMPIWVYLAFSGIRSRNGALALIGSCVLFTLYCIPWQHFVPLPETLASLLLVNDWSWFGTMIPITLWYWLSLRWTDRNGIWTLPVRDRN